MAVKKLKNLANCKPTEFLVQTGKIYKAVEAWLFETDILNISKKAPVLEIVPPGATDEQKEEIKEKNEKAMKDQAKKNLSEIANAVLVEHPEDTAKILALCCFIPPESVDDYQTRDLLAAYTEMINDQCVIDFFASLVRLAGSFSGAE